MKSLAPSRLVGFISGITLFAAYLLLTSAFASTHISEILSGLSDVDEINFASANLYILSGALFLFTFVTIVTTIQNTGTQPVYWNTYTRQVWIFIILMIAFLFLCFPLIILARNILATLLLLASPIMGIYAGREIAKYIRPRFILNSDERRQAYITWIITFLILVGVFYPITS